MNYWHAFTGVVKRNCIGAETKTEDISFWRNELFAGIIIYLLPFCLIALIPGLYWSFNAGLYALDDVDVLVLTAIIAIAFVPAIKPEARKIIFICAIYVLSITLLYYLGVAGPGMLYLLIGAIFSILIFPGRYAFWPAWINSLICLLFIPLVKLDFVSWPQARYHLMGEWLAASTNLVFLSLLAAALIPRLFYGMQQTIDKEKQLRVDLKIQQRSLSETLDMLNQKNSELEQFAYVASHDLNEPLRMITGFMKLLKNKYGGQLDEKAHTYMDFALDGGKRMQKMIADLLELSRTNSREQEKEWIQPGDLLKDIKQNIFRLIEENQVEIILETAPEQMHVYRQDISRLLQNLLTNAIKFKKNNVPAVIKVNVEENDSGWAFTVEDNGIGMEESQSGKIFEIFSRLHSQDEYEGTGIGLAICKKIVENNGGTIRVESEEGKGSRFLFLIKK